MKNARNKPATVRLRLLLFILLIIGTCILTAVLVLSYNASMKKQEVANLVELGGAVSGSAASLAIDFIVEENFVGLDEICLGYVSNPSVVTARIADTHGKIIADSSARTLGTVLAQFPVRLPVGKEEPFLYVQELEHILYINRKLVFESTVFGYILLEVSKEPMLANLHQGRRRIVLLGILFGCIGFLLTWVVSLWLIRPLEQITSMVEVLSKGGSVIDIPSSRIFEVEHLGHSFKQMVEKVTRRETALADERERLSVTLRSLGDGVISTDRKGLVTLLNRAAEEMTGWSEGKARGRSLAEVFQLVNRVTGASCEDPIQQVLSSGQLVAPSGQVMLVSRDGKRRDIAESCAPIRDLSSEIVGAVLVFRDITELRNIEQERLKLKKLESLGTLAGGIAHDFNNILAAILGNINMALYNDTLDEKTVQYLERAEKASLRAKGLTSQLLTFAKGGAPVKETASVAEIVKESAEFVLHGSNVSCTYRIPEDLWLVDIDKDQISQVIQNLVINADHAMPMGGDITICCENCPAEDIDEEFIRTSERYVKISVHDTGVGIPADVLDKVFDPYFSTKHQGSGLGLSICHSILARHEGHISVQSEPGTGTTFSLYLPSAKSQHCESYGRGREEVACPAGKCRIMVMDDEEMVRDIAQAMLTKLQYEVLLAADGDEAIALFSKYRDEGNPVDVIIMDLTIPGGKGGKETVKKILAIDPKAKVIVSSGYSSDPVMANYKEYGFTAAISKPYQMQDIVRGINSTLSH